MALSSFPEPDLPVPYEPDVNFALTPDKEGDFKDDLLQEEALPDLSFLLEDNELSG